jgi:phage portal protein BeeE
MISDAISSVPIVVYNPSGKIEWNHPLTKLFSKPHPDFSRADLMSLMASWSLLTGMSYLRKVSGARNQTRELWPISPDRIAPIASADNNFLLGGYEIQINGGRSVSIDYTRESVIRICPIQNPSNPLLGLSPPDIAISVKGDVTDAQRQSVIKSIMSKFRGSANAGKPLVLSGETTITRLGLTQAEMDFLASRRWNRDEILAIFGVPSQLAGAMESSSYNNYAEAKRIFWINTVLPLLNKLIESFNNSLHDELSEGYYIGPDLSGIDALSDSQDAKLDRAGKLFKMGIPVSIINERYELGIAQYENWDKPFGGRAASSVAASEDRSLVQLEKRGEQNWMLMPTELRSLDTELERREDVAQKHLKPAFVSMLDEQRDLVFGLLDDNEPIDALEDQLLAISEVHIDGIRKLATEAAVDAGNAVVVAKKEKRSMPIQFRDDSNVATRVAALLAAEQVIEIELGFLNASSLEILTALITDSRKENETVQQLKDRLTRGGHFSPDRALRIARTLTGAVSSLGQIASAEEVGAKKKIWNTSGGARDGHAARAGEKRDIDARFSAHYGGSPRWPLDSSTTTKDRVNCRCSLSFSE